MLDLPTIIDFAPGVLAIIATIATAVQWKKLEHEQRCWAVFGVMTLFLTWAFMNSFEKVLEAWKTPQFSHGYLIPVFTLALLYLKRQPFDKIVPTWQQGVGLGIIVVAALVRNHYGFRAVFTPDRLMYIPALIGAMMIIGGLNALKWSALPLLFLGFAYPLPTFIERGFLQPMKALSTKVSHYALETLGVECFTEGNRIVLDKMELGVVDACSGLRMFTIFLALAGGIALVSKRPLWERILIFFPFSIFISLAVNSIRITLTGLAYDKLGNEGEMIKVINTVFHDFAGWIMMPIALGLLALVYHGLARVLIEDEEKELAPIGAVSQ